MVRAAAKLFRIHGVTATGLREIVEAADAPRGSPQHYFPGGKWRDLFLRAGFAEGWPLAAAATDAVAEIPGVRAALGEPGQSRSSHVTTS